jgi:hypothetical protein
MQALHPGGELAAQRAAHDVIVLTTSVGPIAFILLKEDNYAFFVPCDVLFAFEAGFVITGLFGSERHAVLFGRQSVVSC